MCYKKVLSKSARSPFNSSQKNIKLSNLVWLIAGKLSQVGLHHNKDDESITLIIFYYVCVNYLKAKKRFYDLNRIKIVLPICKIL